MDGNKNIRQQHHRIVVTRSNNADDNADDDADEEKPRGRGSREGRWHSDGYVDVDIIMGDDRYVMPIGMLLFVRASGPGHLSSSHEGGYLRIGHRHITHHHITSHHHPCDK